MLTVVLGLGSALGYALHDFLMVKVVRAAAVWTGDVLVDGRGARHPAAARPGAVRPAHRSRRVAGRRLRHGRRPVRGRGAGVPAPRPRHRQPLDRHAAGVAGRRLRRRDRDRRRRVALDAGDDRPAAGRRRRPARLGREGAGRGGVRPGRGRGVGRRRLWRVRSAVAARGAACPPPRPSRSRHLRRRLGPALVGAVRGRHPAAGRGERPAARGHRRLRPPGHHGRAGAGGPPARRPAAPAPARRALRRRRRVRRRGLHPLRRGDRHRAAGGRVRRHRPGRHDGGPARLPRAARAAVAAAVRRAWRAPAWPARCSR